MSNANASLSGNPIDVVVAVSHPKSIPLLMHNRTAYPARLTLESNAAT